MIIQQMLKKFKRFLRGLRNPKGLWVNFSIMAMKK